MVVSSYALSKRVSHIDTGINQLTIAILAGLKRAAATSVSLHANRIQTLEIHVAPQYQSKNREEEALRHGAHLDLSELDISSNCLSEGYSRVPRGVAISLLGICPNLRLLK